MRILITGCNGLLGQTLVKKAPGSTELVGLDIHSQTRLISQNNYQSVDLGDRRAITRCMKTFSPDWVLNAAGYTNVDGAEHERELCWRNNVTAVENLAYACRKTNTKVIHVSTDYIFDGQNGPYAEDDIPNPVGFYGKSKLAGENVLRISELDYAITRTMVLYGHANEIRANFVTWLIAKLRAKETVRIVTDQFGNTTLADELAAGIWRMVTLSAKGVYHIAGREIIDRYNFAVKIAQVFSFDDRLIQPILTADLHQTAPRPMQSGLIVDRAMKELGIELSDAEGGLRKFKKEYESVKVGSRN